MSTKTDILVYAHWLEMKFPKLVGVLTAQQTKGNRVFSFSFDQEWLNSGTQILLDPELSLFKGMQYPVSKQMFGLFSDSMPDTWGRTIMKRRAAIEARKNQKAAPNLYDLDFLLGVHDFCRMGALRYKLEEHGPFLDNSDTEPAPPLVFIRELQQSAASFEEGEEVVDAEAWMNMLYAPGSSLGGARPKANVMDEHGDMWIAKFPSKTDIVNKGLWEQLIFLLATDAGINMSTSSVRHVAGKHHTFFTKRFDRVKNQRVHFASAMTMTGNTETLIRDKTPSYLDIVEFLHYSGANVEADLKQLWRRIVFNIAVSNTDDHLRNHGFLLSKTGWELSPAFDINCSTEKNGLALNIDEHSNDLDIDLAISVAPFFLLNEVEIKEIIRDVNNSVQKWKFVANKLHISRAEQMVMEGAFRSIL